MSNSRSKKLANASGKESIMKASQRKTKDFESSQFSVNEAGSRTLAQSNIGGSHHMKMGHNLTVFDASGNDVTPLPLVSPLKTVRNEAGLGKDSVMDMLNNLDALVLTGSWSASVFERNNMSGVSGSSRASAGSVSDKTEDDDGASIESADSDDGIKFYLYIEGAQTKPSTGKQRDPNQVNQKHIEIDPNKQINLMLRETDTMCFLDIQSICISNDFTEEVQIIKSANAKYKELLSRQNNDNYSDKAMQTFNYPSKSKDIQANPLKFANAECMVNQWCIHDAYIERELIADVDGTENTALSTDSDVKPSASLSGDSSSQIEAASSKVADSIVSFQNGAAGTSMQYIPEDSQSVRNSVSQDNVALAPADSGTGIHKVKDREIDRDAIFNALNQNNLRESLLIMERAVVGNNYVKKLMAFRDVKEPDVADDELYVYSTAPKVLSDEDEFDEEKIEEEEDEELPAPEEKTLDTDSNIPSTEFLWSFRCELTRGRSVTFISFNKHNEDIICISYGECKTNPNSSPGLVLCWSLKNPEWPERIYKSSSPVSAIDFSRSNSNLLAVGYVDGRIAIYDVRRKESASVLDNVGLLGKHRETVWELKWVEQERIRGDEQSRGENLVSISTDGRVTQWIIRKGLEFSDLMTLKRVTKQQESKGATNTSNALSSAKTGAFISRLAGGLCFDFNPEDSNTYIVGTDDGNIHRCSCTLSEQYLATHFGHTGPVYRIRWSPFLSGTFLSCSADWTVRLWNQDSEDATLRFQSGKDSVSDIAWSPNSSTVFGCVSIDGSFAIWDLGFSVLDPVILHSVLDRKLTCIVFAENSPSVMIGDDTGSVNVYKIHNLANISNLTDQEQADLLAKVVDTSLMSRVAPVA